MEIVKFAMIGIICAVLSVTVKQYRPELSTFVQLAGITVLAVFAIGYLRSILTEADSLFDDAKILGDGYLDLLVKVLAIAIITKIGSDICRDSSNSALATVVELVGKAVILVMCLSLIKTLAALAKGLLE